MTNPLASIGAMGYHLEIQSIRKTSGCDVPPMSKWENIDAFFVAVSGRIGSAQHGTTRRHQGRGF